ncbi:hypothetical protein ACOME3_005986 [Neoechinorhynchus agilis]
MSTVAISPFLKTLLAVLLVYRENVLKTGQIPETDSIDRISKNGIVTPSRDFSVYLEKARNLFLAENSPVDEDKVIKLDNVDDYLCSLSILRMPSVGDDLNSGYCATDSDIVKIENPCRGRNVSKMSTNKEPQRKGEEWKSQEQTSTNGMSTFSTNIPTASMESRATETPGPSETSKTEQSEISLTVPEDSNATPSVSQGSETSTGAVAEESSSTIEPGSSTAETTESSLRSNAWMAQTIKMEQSEISTTEKTLEETTAETESNPFGDIELPDHLNVEKFVSEGLETSTGAVAEETSSTIEPGSSTAETTESSLRSNAWMAQTIKMEQSEISTTEKTLEETTAETESNPFGDIELPDHLNVEKFVSEGLETSTGAGAEESPSTIEPGSSTAETTESSLRSNVWMAQTIKMEQSEISTTEKTLEETTAETESNPFGDIELPDHLNVEKFVSEGLETSTGAGAEESSSTIEPGSSTAEITEGFPVEPSSKSEQSEISLTVPEDSNATPSVSQGSETSTGAVAEESSSTIEPGSSTAETTESSLRSNAWMAQTIKMEQSEISSTVTEDSNAQTLVSEGSETSTGAVAEETSSTIEPGSSTTEATEGSPVEPSSKTEQSEISSTVPEDSNTKTLVSEGSETGVSTGAEETSSTIERESSTTETTESARSADEQETGATLPSELSSTEQLELLSSAAQSTEISDAETLDVSSVNVEYDELSTSMPESTSPEFSEQNTESFFSTEGLASLTGMDSEEKGPYKNADDFDKKFNRQDPEPICSETLRGPHLSELKLVEDWRSQSPVYVNIAPDNSLLTRSAREYIMKRRIEGRNNSVIHIHARWDIESAGDNDHPEAVFASHASSIFVANLTSLKIIRSRKLLRVPFRSATYGLAINKNKSIIYVAVAPHHSIVLVDYKTLSQIRAIRIPIKHIIEDIVITNEDDLILSTKSGIYGVDKHDRFLGLLNVGVSIYEPHK